MSTMEYKGYTASVEYDDEAGILYGRVLHLRDGIDFQADNVADLRKEFHASVDDYLEWCAELGEEPEKPFSGKFVVRIDPTLHRDAAIAAVRDGVSLNEWVKKSLETSLKPAGRAIPASRQKQREVKAGEHSIKVPNAFVDSFVALVEASLPAPPSRPATPFQPEQVVVKTSKANFHLTPRQRETNLN